jgi:hypothetical protein
MSHRIERLRISIAVGFGLAAISVCSAITCKTRAGESSSRSSGERYELQHGYQAGQVLRLVTMQTIQQRSKEEAGRKDDYDSSSTRELSISVSGGDNDTLKLMAICKRMAGSTSRVGITSSSDSEKPETIETDKAGANYSLMKGKSFVFTLDASGMVVHTSFDQELKQKFKLPASLPEGYRDKAIETFIGNIATEIKSPWSFLPQESKAVGNTWVYRGPASPILGTLRVEGRSERPWEETTCRLEEILQSAEGREAVISVSGKFWNPAKKDVQSSTVITGKATCNIDGPVRIRQVVNIAFTDDLQKTVITRNAELRADSPAPARLTPLESTDK